MEKGKCYQSGLRPPDSWLFKHLHHYLCPIPTRAVTRHVFVPCSKEHPSPLNRDPQEDGLRRVSVTAASMAPSSGSAQ